MPMRRYHTQVPVSLNRSHSYFSQSLPNAQSSSRTHDFPSTDLTRSYGIPIDSRGAKRVLENEYETDSQGEAEGFDTEYDEFASSDPEPDNEEEGQEVELQGDLEGLQGSRKEEGHDEDEEELIDDSPYLEDLASQRSPYSYLTSARTSRDEENYDDDAAEFEELMRLTEAMRAGSSIQGVEAGHTGDGGEGSPHQIQNRGDVGDHRSRGDVTKLSTDRKDDDEKRRTEAIEFLESFPISLLTQLRDSLVILDARERGKERSSNVKNKKNNKSKTTRTNADNQVEEEIQNEEVNEQSGGKIENGNQKVGVELSLKNRKTGNEQVMSFPDDPTFNSNKEPSLHRITSIMRVASILHEAVLERTVITLRDIFYRDKALFKRQDVVDKLVDDLVATAALKRKDFYVCASAKGLVASSALKIIRHSGEEVVLFPTSPTLIDPVERIDRLEAPNGLRSVLVVEKEAVFQSLCSAKILEDERHGCGVMVTGKGFPDLATRQFLHLLVETFPNVKLYGLVDADPHGLSILSTYTFGSRATTYSHDHAGLLLGDRLEWLGVRATDWRRLGIKHDDLLPLEKADIHKAMSMLRNHPTLPADWRRELCHMLHLNRKAEIETVLGSTNGHINGDKEDALDDLFEDRGSTYASGSGSERKSSISQPRGRKKRTGINKLVEYVMERMC
ncbi:hypothetical protein IAR55_003179 [Kwoniella newhampshirensis]|uniref:DNA topoisomerase (ATP-hydrolyzing) n=1 Tax=Kwoniella newhampshirensis TaxID=1651941 RepID=A0AAW0YSN1_9TREE